MALISKQEFKYIIYASVFGFFYFLYLLPYLLKNGIENQSPYLQFFLFGIGLYIIYFFIFKSWSLGTTNSFYAALSGMLPILALDLIYPEYHVNLMSGVIEKGATLGSASTDYVIGTFWSNLGISGYLLVPLVYLVSFALLLILAALIKKNFVKGV